MKRLLIVFITLFFISCSFDNKTGIWKDASTIPVDKQDVRIISENSTAERYESISTTEKMFNEEIEATNVSNIKIDEPLKTINWFEHYGIPTNNISNFFYNGNGVLLSKSSNLGKISSDKNYSSRKIIFYNNNLISHDHKGTIFVYSLGLNKKIFKYNFYKKNFKDFQKKINLIINDNVLYAADNLGYIYAINLKDKSIIWAKNYGIPFRSNLKFTNNQIFLANQDNVIYSIDSLTGEKKWQFATSQTLLKSDFQNNFALDLINNNLIFLNTNGELYSIDYLSQKINWVLNFKNSAINIDTALFLSQPMILKSNNLIISGEKSLSNYDPISGVKKWILPSEPISKPIITLSHTFAVLKNNLLICVDNISGKVIWSQNIFSDIKKRKVVNNFGSITDFKIVNGKINIYSKNGYLLTFNSKNGNFNSFVRISKNGISSKIIFLDNNMLFVDSKNKLLKFN